MDVKVILVSMEGEGRAAYLEALQALGVEADVVSSFEDLYGLMSQSPYNGVLVDLVTKVNDA